MCADGFTYEVNSITCVHMWSTCKNECPRCGTGWKRAINYPPFKSIMKCPFFQLITLLPHIVQRAIKSPSLTSVFAVESGPSFRPLVISSTNVFGQFNPTFHYYPPLVWSGYLSEFDKNWMSDASSLVLPPRWLRSRIIPLGDVDWDPPNFAFRSMTHTSHCETQSWQSLNLHLQVETFAILDTG